MHPFLFASRRFFVSWIAKFLGGCLKLKWHILEFYYRGLLVQANYLYRQSPLFKHRWQELGLAFAENSFKDDVQLFFWKAQREPRSVRMQIFFDALFRRKPRPYYISGEEMRH